MPPTPTSVVNPLAAPLRLLTVVIPARDEADCLAATVEHLCLELNLNHIPHEIVVVDDGSSERTWPLLQELAGRIPALRPVRNEGPHGCGRAVTRGIDAAQGEAVVVMMASLTNGKAGSSNLEN